MTGPSFVGVLAGWCEGSIAAVSATGRASGLSLVGGLVGSSTSSIASSYARVHVAGVSFVGGLSGLSSDITSSYATGAVSGRDRVGGLVGESYGITSSYATGAVSGQTKVGGLAGTNGGSITASYATGTVSGSSSVGGLVGANNAGTSTATYWDTETSGLADSAEGVGLTTSALQTPTSASGVFATWNTSHWHFGTASQYPALLFDANENGTSTWQEFGYQLRAGPTLTATGGKGQAKLTWTAVETSDWTPAPAVTYTVTRSGASTLKIVAEGLGELQYTDDVPEGTYRYQVVAVVDGGEAAHSASVEVTVAPPNRPPQPVGSLANQTLQVGASAGRGGGRGLRGRGWGRSGLQRIVVGRIGGLRQSERFAGHGDGSVGGDGDGHGDGDGRGRHEHVGDAELRRAGVEPCAGDGGDAAGSDVADRGTARCR